MYYKYIVISPLRHSVPLNATKEPVVRLWLVQFLTDLELFLENKCQEYQFC